MVLKGEELYKKGMTANEYILLVWQKYKNDAHLPTVARDFARLKKKYSNLNTIETFGDWDFDSLPYMTVLRLKDVISYFLRHKIEITNKILAKHFSKDIIETLMQRNPNKVKKEF